MTYGYKVRDFIERGRELYAQCPGPHSGISGARRIPIDLSKLDPEMTLEELKAKVRCSVCGMKAGGRGVLLIPQTDRQMRQGRQR
jgi:hypothetical protein